MSAKAPAPLGGAILAGGASTRMGQDKATLRLPDGRAMIAVVAKALAAHCEPVVVAGTSSALTGVLHIADLRTDAGPLAGIEAVLAHDLAASYVFCPCDLFALTAEMIAPLASAPGRSRAVVLRVMGEARFRPLPARIGGDALPVIREALDAGEGAVHRVLDRLTPMVVDVPAEWGEVLRGANAPPDLDGESSRWPEQR